MIPSLATRSFAAPTPTTWPSSKTTPVEFDQLHRHGASCGPDPHLRREGPQRLGAEPLSNTLTATVPKRQRKNNSSSSQGMRTAETPWFQTWGKLFILGCQCRPTYRTPFRPRHAFTTGANPFGYHVTSVQIYLSRASRRRALPTHRSPYGPTTGRPRRDRALHPHHVLGHH